MAGVMGEGLALLATDLHALAEMLDALDADGDLQQMNSHDTLTAVSTSAPGQPRRPAIGRAHVRTPVTNAHLVCRLHLEKKKNQKTYFFTSHISTSKNRQ